MSILHDGARNHEIIELLCLGCANRENAGDHPRAVAVHGDGPDLRSSDDISLPRGRSCQRLIHNKRSGKVAFPVDRALGKRDGHVGSVRSDGVGPSLTHVIAWSKDLGRTLDHLEMRRDFDSSKLTYMGYSLGGAEAPLLLAIDRCFKASIVLSGGFQMNHEAVPEVNPFNVDPYMVTPTLILNGRYDRNFSLEASQRPFFQFMARQPGTRSSSSMKENMAPFPGRRLLVRYSTGWISISDVSARGAHRNTPRRSIVTFITARRPPRH